MAAAEATAALTIVMEASHSLRRAQFLKATHSSVAATNQQQATERPTV